MKKILFSFVTILTLSVNAQLVLVPNDTIESSVTTTDYFDLFSQHIYVINNFSGDNFKWEVDRLDKQADPSIVNLCDPNNCYPIPAGNIFPFNVNTADSADIRAEVLPRCISGTYVLRVKVYSTTDSVNRKAYLTFITHVTSNCNPDGIGEQLSKSAKIYSNPFNTSTQLEILNNEVYSVNIYDFSGRQLSNVLVNNETVLEIGNNLPSGLFILQLTNSSGKLLGSLKLEKK